MASFIWHDRLKNLPASWRDTRGQSVRVGIIDSGILYGHPVLQHQDKPGRKYDCRLARPTGNDDVSDCRPVGKPHGTSCASIVAGLSALDNSVEGMAPKVEVHVFRAVNAFCDPTLEIFMRALKAAAAADVDILSVSLMPLPDQNIPQAEIDRVFQSLADKNICLFAALRNTNSWNMLNRVPFPANRPESITAGVATPALLDAMPADGRLSRHINFLAPQCPVAFHAEPDEEDPQQGVLRSSFATAAIAGVAALALAEARKKAQNPLLRLSRDAMLERLQSIATPFSQEAMQGEDSFRLFFNQP